MNQISPSLVPADISKSSTHVQIAYIIIRF